MDFEKRVRRGRDPRTKDGFDLVQHLDLEKLSHSELDSLGRVLAKAGDDGDRKRIIEAGRRQGKRLRFDGPDY